MRKYLPYLLSTLIGALVWIIIGSVVEMNEAWDSSVYYSVGLPVMAVAVIVISGMWPAKPWRWAVLMVLAQAAVLFYQSPSSMNLWPLTLVIFLVLIAVLTILAFLGSIIRKRIIEKKSA